MSTPYTPSAVKLIQLNLPQDVVDKVIVATVNPNSQKVADGIEYVYSVQECVGLYGIVTPGSGPYVLNDYLTLSPISEGPGLSYNSGTKRVDVASAGKYLVCMSCEIQVVDPANPLQATLEVVDFNTGETFCSPRAIRYNSSSLYTFFVQASGIGRVLSAPGSIGITPARASGPSGPLSPFPDFDTVNGGSGSYGIYNLMSIQRLS